MSAPPAGRSGLVAAAAAVSVFLVFAGMAALALSLVFAPSAARAQACDRSGFCDAKALASFLHALADLQSGKRIRPVQILQIGDSHTAADHITGALRARLQARFGEAGRGALPPGRPFKGYNPRQVEVTQSDGWRIEASFVPGGAANGQRPGDPYTPVHASGPFGLSGWRLVSNRSEATVTLKADPEAQFDQATVCALAGPDSGDLTITADQGERRMPLAAIRVQPVCRKFEFGAPQSHLTLTSAGRPVTLLSFATTRARPGVTLANLGMIGTQVGDFALRDDEVMRAELEAYTPDLIVLAYGTNDGFSKSVDGAGFEALVRSQIERLHRLAPNAPVLVLGAPDAETIRPDIPMDGKHDLNFACAPLTPAETADYPGLVARHAGSLARWYEPPNLTIVREAQRRAALGEGAAFWDWSARMGGACSAHRLSKLDPRLVRGDHIHYTTDGGALIADLLWKDLSDAYSAVVGGR